MPVAAPAEKQVRIVIDDSAVKDSEIGRRSLTRNLLLVVVGALLGVAAGFGVGNTVADNRQYELAARDREEIHARVTKVSATLDAARTSLKAAVDATQGGPGKQAHVDYKAIGDLVALPKPFNAGEFSRRRYLAFSTTAVDALFDYYNSINLLWSKFETLGARTAGPAAREALDKSAQAGDQLVTQEFGVVVSKVQDQFVGGLVVLRPKTEAPGVALVSTRTGAREVERKVFSGQDDFAGSTDHYVVFVDKARSMGVLGAGATLFGQVRADLVDAQKLLDRIVETQGRLSAELEKSATPSE